MRFQRFRPGRAAALRLEHAKIFLRPPVQRDWRAWAVLRAESRDFLLPWEPTWAYDALTRGAFRRRLRMYRSEMRQDTSFSFLIFRRADKALLGGVTLSNLRRGAAQTASLGYWIGARHCRQGYMTQALDAVLDFAFERLVLHRIEAACLPDNHASKALLLKCRFREEGFARDYLRINGRWQDHLLFAMLADDFKSSKKA